MFTSWYLEWRKVFKAHLRIKQQCDEQAIRDAKEASLSPEFVELVRYFVAVEGVTPIMARYLRLTPSGWSKHIAKFLVKWNAEEINHARALMAACGECAEGSSLPTVDQAYRRAKSLSRPYLLVKVTTYDVLSSYALGFFFLPVHMTFGALSETITRFGYWVLEEHSDCPVFKNLVRKIVVDESGHLATYLRAARLLCRFAPIRIFVDLLVRKVYSPVGVTIMPKGEPGKIVRALFLGKEERLKSELKRKFDGLLSDKTIKVIVGKTIALGQVKAQTA